MGRFSILRVMVARNVIRRRSDEVLLNAELAEPITATQKVLIVFRVKHVKHEIRCSVKCLVVRLTLFLPSIVHHRHQSGNLRFLRG